jgi:UDP-N-acetylglucosamine acyltransferase
MAYVHIAHDSQLGNHITLANAVSLAGHVEIGDGATLGGFSLVHQFCRIGQHAFTGIGTVCLKDVPPFVMAAGHSAAPYGINVRGLRRRGFDDESVSALQRAYRHLYRSGLDLKAALAAIKVDSENVPVVVALATFVENSTRGIIR